MPPRAGKAKTTTAHLRRMLEFDSKHLTRPSLFSALASGSFEAPVAVIGIDEVGRGCLAGPVVAAAVMLPEISKGSKLARRLSELNDSKALDARKREELSAVLRETAVFAVSEATVEEIDDLNILNASLLAMRRARMALPGVPPSIVLVDGNKTVPGISDLQVPVVKGDSLSASIAAASIIAKVYRDNLMVKLAETYPHYNWHLNKGYGSSEHKQAVARVGLSPMHRRSFNCEM